MKLDEAERLAAEVADWLRPGYRCCEVVGSIRRRKPEVKDVELAIKVPVQAGLFAEFPGFPRSDLLDDAIAHLVEQRRLLRWHLPTPEHPAPAANGPRLKRLFVPSENVVLELWIADSDANWGNVLAIRTGDRSFGRLLVTSRARGGLMPEGMREDGGYLWRGAERLDCPDERSLFAALGIGEVPDPAARTGTLARRLARQVGRGA